MPNSNTFCSSEHDREPHNPLILSRPFLATAGAMIVVQIGKINFKLGNITLNFAINDSFMKPTIEGQAFPVDQIIDVAEEVYNELFTKDPLELALTK